MCAHHEKQQEPHGYGNLTVVALTILMMGLSVAAVLPPSLRNLANGTSNTNTTSNSNNSSLSQVVGKFTARLTGQDEVLPTNTKASGTAEFTSNSDGKTMGYNVNVNNIDKVTMADIHQGKKGENGPVIVTLIRFKPLTPTGPVNGQLAQGNISGTSLVSHLTKLIEDNYAYVNVQTKQYPDGEIRGQISR